MRRKPFLIGAAMALALAAPAAAWNAHGHMMVAAKAWEALTPQSRQAVGKLLRLNPMYSQWTAGVAASERDRAAFVHAATWPDDIKSASGYVNDHDQAGPDGARNIGYADCDQHRYWHFLDQPFSPDGTALEQPAPPNAETQIRLFRDALAAPSTSDDVKSYDLVWLIHMVGDVHQPLHAASRFTADAAQGDRGGNSVKVCDPQCGHNLHAAWDDALGNERDAASAISAAAALPTASPGSSNPSTWLGESLALAKSVVYSLPVGAGLGPFTLTPAYETQVRATAKTRVALAGARLAALINGAHLTVHGTSAARCGGGITAGGGGGNPHKPKAKHHRRHGR
jgi:hypothetical protein